MLSKFLTATAVVVSAASSSAATISDTCDGIGLMASKLAEARISGVPYKTQLARNRVTARGTSDAAAMIQLTDALTRLVYVEMPKLSPEGAYNMAHLMCSSGK